MQRRLWKVKKPNPRAQILAKKYNLDPLLVQILLNRDVNEDDFQPFLNSTQANFHNPHLLPDIDKAAARVKLAIARKEKVLVFGDYDVDGVTSLAIFYEFTKSFPEVFSFYIPHRVKEGYGLNKEAIARAKEEKVSLIVAFDCGSNAYQELALAKSLGIDVIVVDHHSLPKTGIATFALINPQRKDSGYPFSDLSAAALSLQVLTAKDFYEVLDLVALSLVCDVVPLRGENRVLLKEGIKVIRETQRLAIKALCQVAGIRQENIDTFHIGYILGPRINASGRMAHAQESFELFLTEEKNKAYKLASQLSEYNQLRKTIETQILKEAEQRIQYTLSEEQAIVVSGDDWHPGVLGIVASRLADKYHKPSFVISFNENVGKGSGRSIQSVHLLEMLDQCADLLLEYGGHKKAAGMQITRDELENFKDKINTLIGENISPQDFIPLLEIEAKLRFKNINRGLIEALEELKPYGEGNPIPLFSSYNIFKKTIPRKIGSGFSVWLSDGIKTFEGIIYDPQILEIINYADSLDIAFTLQMNNYYDTPQLIIRDCRLPEGKV